MRRFWTGILLLSAMAAPARAAADVKPIKLLVGKHAVVGAEVPVSFFKDAGVQPIIGRLFVEGDRSGQVAVVSERLWASYFNRDPTLIGAKIDVNRRKFVVLGIIPKALDTPTGADIWLLSRR